MNTPAQTKRVLLAEDDAQTSEGLALVLEMAGYDTRTAANGVEAIQESRTWQPDLILLDLVMPLMDGWSFRKQQMEDRTLADIPVVILSCCGDAARHQASRMGIPSCFNKSDSGDGVLNLMGDLFDVLDRGGVGFHGGDGALSNSHNTASAGAPSAR
jgi:CheY-like chemotaxis protein